MNFRNTSYEEKTGNKTCNSYSMLQKFPFSNTLSNKFDIDAFGKEYFKTTKSDLIDRPYYNQSYRFYSDRLKKNKYDLNKNYYSLVNKEKNESKKWSRYEDQKEKESAYQARNFIDSYSHSIEKTSSIDFKFDMKNLKKKKMSQEILEELILNRIKQKLDKISFEGFKLGQNKVSFQLIINPNESQKIKDKVHHESKIRKLKNKRKLKRKAMRVQPMNNHNGINLIKKKSQSNYKQVKTSSSCCSEKDYLSFNLKNFKKRKLKRLSKIKEKWF
jgi:hypothetical protein